MLTQIPESEQFESQNTNFSTQMASCVECKGRVEIEEIDWKYGHPMCQGCIDKQDEDKLSQKSEPTPEKSSLRAKKKWSKVRRKFKSRTKKLDSQCRVCQGEFRKRTKTPCGHRFCFECVEHLIEKCDRTCPYPRCGQTFPEDYSPSKTEIKFKFIFSHATSQGTTTWKAKIKSLSEDYSDVDLIESVQFRYGNHRFDQETVTESPFMITKQNHAESVFVRIKWRSYMRTKPVFFDQPLNFKRSKQTFFFQCYFDYKPLTKIELDLRFDSFRAVQRQKRETKTLFPQLEKWNLKMVKKGSSGC